MNITKRSQIPDAPFYVLCNDDFLGDTLIFPCASYDEADYVFCHASFQRNDQKYERIVMNKPRLQSHRRYTLHDKNDYPTWYGRFAKL